MIRMLHDVTYQSDAKTLKADKTKVDPRLMICAGQPYVDDYIGSAGETTWYDRSSEVNNRPDILAWQHRKYTNIRGVEMGSEPYGKNESSDCNYFVIRLADIYLLYAELMQDENPGLALQYVNKVRPYQGVFRYRSACQRRDQVRALGGTVCRRPVVV